MHKRTLHSLAKIQIRTRVSQNITLLSNSPIQYGVKGGGLIY